MDDFVWPDVPRTAFESATPAYLNAQVDWLQTRPDAMRAYVDGYREAAEAIFGLAENKSPEKILFPLAFAWRHHLELSLKHLISLRPQFGLPEENTQGHNLDELWRRAKPLVETCGNPADLVLTNVTAGIQEIMQVDQASDAFRYPTRPNQTRHTGLPREINLASMHVAMRALSAFFSGVLLALEHRLDLMAEHEHELRDLERERERELLEDLHGFQE